MPIKRVFLNWNRPALDGIVSFLVENYIDGSELDLSNCLLVFSGSKAGRRLQEKLAIYAEQFAIILTPPNIITTGSLPEKLYSTNFPIANNLESILARIHALRNFNPQILKKVTGLLPEENQLGGWMNIAKNIGSLHAEIAAECLSFEQVGKDISLMPTAPEDDRWRVLADLQQLYHKHLEQVELTDREEARRQAILENRINYSGDIIFCAVREINLVTQKMLDLLTSEVITLIHAPEIESLGFDQYGSVQTEYWLSRDLNIPDEIIIAANNFRDQALAILGEVSKLEGTYHHSEIIIGQTSSTFLPHLTSLFSEASISLHDPSGKVLSETRPSLLLKKIKEYLSQGKVSDFYDLIRFPEVESLISRELAQEGLVSYDSLLTKVDRYQINHLQFKVFKEPHKLDGEDDFVIRAINIIEQILLELKVKTKSLDEWIIDLQELLTRFYPEPLRFQSEFEAMDRVWDLMAESHLELLPKVVGVEALGIFLKLCSDVQIPNERQLEEIDMLGWLELQLEDAPVLFIGGMNEGLVPESVNSDTFLPQSVRKHLGLLDNDRRYARDAFVLLALVNSVENLKLFYTHRDSEGTALLPSRLLVSSAKDRFLSKVQKLYLSEAKSRVLKFDTSKTSLVPKWQIPPLPEAMSQTLNTLSVTGFKSYLACPYRFYLTHILKLESVDDSLLEMDGRIFGNIGHEVLARFIQGQAGIGSNLSIIKKDLNEILDQVFLDHFGIAPLPTVLIQREQLRSRLDAFAEWQADWRKKGWTTYEIEGPGKTKNITLDVDGQDFHIYGRIDRIDFHPLTKEWAVFDYKFGEKTLDPENAHRKKDEWNDLQLPLYHQILIAAGFQGKINLGYIRLTPGISPNQMMTFVDWNSSDFEDAHNCTLDIIRKIRLQKFWPPIELNYPDDPFAAVLGLEQFLEEDNE